MANIGTHKGGREFNDRVLSARVRTLALNEIEKILKKPKHKLYSAVIIKLAGSVLPRMNEHTGADGEPLVLSFDNAFKLGTPRPPKGNSK